MAEILLTNKEWKEIESKLENSIFRTIKVKIGKDTVDIVRKLEKNKILNAIYINGYIKGAETQENQEKYWYKHTRYFKKCKAGEREKEKRKLIRSFGKKAGMEMWDKWYGEGSKYIYYLPYFGSVKTLIREYKKRHKEVYWIQGDD